MTSNLQRPPERRAVRPVRSMQGKAKAVDHSLFTKIALLDINRPGKRCDRTTG